MKKIIRYSGVIIIIFSFLVVPDFYAQSCRNYIDVPTANISNGFFINLSGSYAVGGQTEEKFGGSGSIEYGVAGFLAGLKVYATKTFCLDLAYTILEESGSFPGLSIGLENITNSKYVAPLDTSDVVDFLYAPRPPEIASVYMAVTKELGDYVEMTAGLGRGRFVGYGPRSQYLNFDAFFDEKHPDFMFGMFGGVKFNTPVGVSFIFETDGRDANAGLRYEASRWKGTLSVDKIEHLIAQPEGMINSPRFNLSLSVNPVGRGAAAESNVGTLKIAIMDKSSGRPIQGKIIVSHGNIERSYDVPIAKKKVLMLKPGVYKITVFSAGYKMKTANVPVKAGKDLEFEISLDKVISPAIKQSMDLTKAAATDYKYGRLKEAKGKLEEAIALYPNNNKAKQGLQLVDKALADNISSLKNQARSREASGDISGAIALWEQVLALENTSATRTYIQSLRDKLAARSRPAPARTTTTSTRPTTTATKAPAPAKKPSLTQQQIADLYTKGLSAYFDGNYKEAVKYFEQVLRADPNHAQAKRYLGEAKKH
jgi:tetratricopeptide (TPR) repeat protein